MADKLMTSKSQDLASTVDGLVKHYVVLSVSVTTNMEKGLSAALLHHAVDDRTTM